MNELYVGYQHVSKITQTIYNIPAASSLQNQDRLNQGHRITVERERERERERKSSFNSVAMCVRTHNLSKNMDIRHPYFCFQEVST